MPHEESCISQTYETHRRSFSLRARTIRGKRVLAGVHCIKRATGGHPDEATVSGAIPTQSRRTGGPRKRAISQRERGGTRQQSIKLKRECWRNCLYRPDCYSLIKRQALTSQLYILCFVSSFLITSQIVLVSHQIIINRLFYHTSHVEYYLIKQFLTYGFANDRIEATCRSALGNQYTTLNAVCRQNIDEQAKHNNVILESLRYVEILLTLFIVRTREVQTLEVSNYSCTY